VRTINLQGGKNSKKFIPALAEMNFSGEIKAAIGYFVLN